MIFSQTDSVGNQCGKSDVLRLLMVQGTTRFYLCLTMFPLLPSFVPISSVSIVSILKLPLWDSPNYGSEVSRRDSFRFEVLP